MDDPKQSRIKKSFQCRVQLNNRTLDNLGEEVTTQEQNHYLQLGKYSFLTGTMTDSFFVALKRLVKNILQYSIAVRKIHVKSK